MFLLKSSFFIKRFFIVPFLFSSVNVSAGNDFSVSFIPDSIKENADVVTRIHTTKVSVLSTQNYEVETEEVYTFLNQNGEKSKLNIIREYYDSFSQIVDIDATIYDAYGNQIRHYGKVKFDDVIAFDGASLVSDQRMLVKRIDYGIFPYTISIKKRIRSKNGMYYPQWFPISEYRMALMKSTYSISIPENIIYNYKTYNLRIEPTIEKIKGIETKIFKIENIKAIDDSPLEKLDKVVPYMRISPIEFVLDKYKGNLKSWKSFGEFICLLNEGRQDLELSDISNIKKIADSANSIHEKVDLLYRYMQSQTRYVGIQLGIGGWQPFNAKYVHKNKYGDCKALSNYMMTLLSVCGISSYYTLVMAGDNSFEVDTTFPAAHFNHAFLMVPIENDTLWLECTSNTYPTGFKNTFTDNRYVMAVIPGYGGKILKTRKLDFKDNWLKTTTKFSNTENGNTFCKIISLKNGQFYDYPNYLKYHLNSNEKKEFLKSKLELKNFTIKNYDIEDNRLAHLITEKIELVNSNSYINDNGSTIINPIFPFRPYLFANRVSKGFFIKRNYLVEDSLVFTLGERAKGRDVSIKNISEYKSFGNFELKVEQKDANLVLYRKIQINAGEYNTDIFQDYKRFFNKLIAESQESIILKQTKF